MEEHGRMWLRRALVAVVMVCSCMLGAVEGTVLLSNGSGKTVTVSSNASAPTTPGVTVAPGQSVSLAVGTYYVSNVKVVMANLVVDTRTYPIRNAPLSVGLVQLYLAPLGAGTLGPVADLIPITGEF